MLSAIGGGALEVAGFELVYVTAPGDGVRELPLKSWRVLYVTGLPGVILA